MDECQRSVCVPRRAREGVGMHFTSQAGFTDGIRASLSVHGCISDLVVMQ